MYWTCKQDCQIYNFYLSKLHLIAVVKDLSTQERSGGRMDKVLDWQSRGREFESWRGMNESSWWMMWNKWGRRVVCRVVTLIFIYMYFSNFKMIFLIILISNTFCKINSGNSPKNILTRVTKFINFSNKDTLRKDLSHDKTHPLIWLVCIIANLTIR